MTGPGSVFGRGRRPRAVDPEAPAAEPNWAKQNKENVARARRERAAREAEAAEWIEQVKARRKPARGGR